jgi:hypothetical protein
MVRDTRNYPMGLEEFEDTKDKVCQWLVEGQWFSPDTVVSSTNKTDRHEITEPQLNHIYGFW